MDSSSLDALSSHLVCDSMNVRPNLPPFFNYYPSRMLQVTMQAVGARERIRELEVELYEYEQAHQRAEERAPNLERELDALRQTHADKELRRAHSELRVGHETLQTEHATLLVEHEALWAQMADLHLRYDTLTTCHRELESDVPHRVEEEIEAWRQFDAFGQATDAYTMERMPGPFKEWLVTPEVSGEPMWDEMESWTSGLLDYGVFVGPPLV